MPVLQLAAVLITLAALFGTINYLFLRLPQAIGILVVALATSLAILGLDALIPGFALDDRIRLSVRELHFSDALLEGMLGLLLFAGALHLNLADLRKQWAVVALMATLGVGISTAIVGTGFSWFTGMPILIALVFGAIVTPTDPVAVLGVLREAKLPKSLEIQIAGESLFNDGVAYVLFLVLVGLAFPGGADHAAGLGAAAWLFVQEALGGAALGAVLGFLTFRVMRRIDDYGLEVLITLALAFGGYELAIWLHVSGPIMAVVAGLFIGHVGMERGMSAETRAYVDAFWKLVDEILNAILFLMIGIEVFAIAFPGDHLMAGLFAIGLALFARFVAVAVPVGMLRPFRQFAPGVVPIMTWGGLKGGISVALALSLPDSAWTPLILTVTYVIVVFSILAQGLTIAPLARRLTAPRLL
ncbi:MAG TPA: sodium:proton antiporter [Rhodobacteraceae bacterium]|nr:sodium:proton antiporter [Paracoccaceae bacterium]